MLIKVEGLGEIEVEGECTMYAENHEGTVSVFLDSLQGDALPDVQDLTQVIQEKAQELYQRIVSAHDQQPVNA